MNPFFGQISTFAFGPIPFGWAACNGQLLSVNQNQALFSLLGTTYGGDGRTTFALPNLQGQFAVGQGQNFVMGQTAGEATHTLTVAEIAAHAHPASASSGATSQSLPANNYPTTNSPSNYAATANTVLGTGTTTAGGSQAHPNVPPALAIAYCIALQGLFPSRS